MADVILVVTAILQAKMMCLQLWENPESFKFCLTQHMTRCPQLSGKTIVVSVHSANIHSLAYITYKTSYDANINPCSACKEICNCGLCPYSDQTAKMVSPSAYFIPKVCKNFLKFFISSLHGFSWAFCVCYSWTSALIADKIQRSFKLAIF